MSPVQVDLPSWITHEQGASNTRSVYHRAPHKCAILPGKLENTATKQPAHAISNFNLTPLDSRPRRLPCMADLLFSIRLAKGFDPRVWETAYITGIEGIPWFCQHELSGDEFRIGRQIDESGKLHLLWPTKSAGTVCLSTTSLRPVDHPYQLAVEIARGTLYQLKTQTDEWQRVGLRLPKEYFDLASKATKHFLDALVGISESEQATSAQEAIEHTLLATQLLVDSFSLQALEARKNNEGRLATLLGCQLDSTQGYPEQEPALRESFNLGCVAADFGSVESNSGKRNFELFDSQVDWISQSDQKLCVGPLVDFRKGQLPEWMILLNEGFESIMEAACEHAARTVARYKGKVHLWNCATGVNVPNPLKWNDQEILQMAVALIETVRKADERTPVLLTIDQPFSEYLRSCKEGISPLHFADALIRADLGLSGLALELNFDQWPGGTFPRHLIELNQLIDRWSMLGLPLMILLRSPTASASEPRDPAATRVSRWPLELESAESDANSPQALPNINAAQGIIPPESIVRLLTSKPAVHAVIWSDQCDAKKDCSTGEGILCGLWDQQGQPKQLLTSTAKLRDSYLH